MSMKIERMDLHAPVSFSGWGRSSWKPYVGSNGHGGVVVGAQHGFKKAGDDSSSMGMLVSGYSDQESHNKK